MISQPSADPLIGSRKTEDDPAAGETFELVRPWGTRQKTDQGPCRQFWRDVRGPEYGFSVGQFLEQIGAVETAPRPTEERSIVRDALQGKNREKLKATCLGRLARDEHVDELFFGRCAQWLRPQTKMQVKSLRVILKR